MTSPQQTIRLEDFGIRETARERGRPDWTDAAFFVALAVAAYIGYLEARHIMTIYDKWILVGAVPSLAWVGWLWRPMRRFLIVTLALGAFGVWFYQGDLARAEGTFLMRYFLSSQSAILWMCLLYFLATFSYWTGIIARSETANWMATRFTWAATIAGTVGLLVRWHETHLMGPGMGYIPVSNLYEVFVLFALVTTLFYLYYEEHYNTRALGAFVMLIVAAAVGFLLWYSVARQAHEIEPLVPALQSWWMKLHVPTNFIGYGTFALAAMVAFAYLIKVHGETKSWRKLAPLFVLGTLLAVEPIIFSRSGFSMYWALYFGIGAVLVGIIIGLRRRIAPMLPSLELLDDIMYKAIAVGWAFFTVATILGALWAAEAWGAYWQWDPKETWALIVWLNYAAWLHFRLVKGVRGVVGAYWSLVGLLITGFAFLGVNMFLSGLHSYGAL